jgi:hypothetical protein|tara:strand:+ start:127 stop:297 length:171 start_codon:yes stop_codon:yes gene_type:complete
VPTKHKEQLPKNHLDALFYKLKADQLRVIYECISGENGLLKIFSKVENFEDLFLEV